MILSSKARLAGAGLVALSLAGCGVTPVAPNVDTPGMPNAEVALQKSMDDTAREMARIGAIEPSAAVASKPTVVAGELDRVVSMQWNGALDGAVRRLGETIGYRTAVTGKAPQAGVNVAVDPAPRRVYDILHGLGDQAGDAATVRVDRAASAPRGHLPWLSAVPFCSRRSPWPRSASWRRPKPPTWRRGLLRRNPMSRPRPPRFRSQPPRLPRATTA